MDEGADDESNLGHLVVVGDSSANIHHPANQHGVRALDYAILLWRTCISELRSFYSIYLILLMMVQCADSRLSTSQPWTTIVPVILILAASYFLQARDLHRVAVSTGELSRLDYRVCRDHEWVNETNLRDVRCGDIIEFVVDSPDGRDSPCEVPCDCIILSSRSPDGSEPGPVEIQFSTAVIDGETVLTPKKAVTRTLPPHGVSGEQYIISATSPSSDSRLVRGYLDCHTPLLGDRPLEQLHQTLLSDDDDDTEKVAFSPENFVEQGSSFYTAGRFYLIALYTGSDCRSATARMGFCDYSHGAKTVIDDYLEQLTVIAFLIQFVLAVIFGFIGNSYNKQRRVEYIATEHFRWTPIVLATENYLLMSFMIPVTLKVVLPLMRWVYGVYIENDANFIDRDSTMRPIAYTTNVTENIGHVDIIVADKTGTLTKNKPIVAMLAVGDRVFGTASSPIDIFDDLKPDDDVVTRALFCLALCHSAVVRRSPRILAESPEDVAILRMLRRNGISVVQDENLVAVKFGDEVINQFEILDKLPFSHERKRALVATRWVGQNRTFVWMKGAPAVVREFTTAPEQVDPVTFERFGFRTLSFACLEVDEGVNLEEPPREFEMLGSIAFSDTLQQDARVSLQVLRAASIKIWIATGDAFVTSFVTCQKLSLVEAGKVLRLEPAGEFFPAHFARAMQEIPENEVSVAIDCTMPLAVTRFLERSENVAALLRARCVMFYRCRPATKGEVVVWLQNGGQRVLAVGDGSNDSELLKRADVGVGLSSRGQSYVLAHCDFALPSFHSVCRLILVHGHLSLHRSKIAVHFSFYKGMLVGLVQAISQRWTYFSAQSFFDSFALVTYNILWTSVPMVSILFDRPIPDNFLLNRSTLYRNLRASLALNVRGLRWLWAAMYQSIVTMFVAWGFAGEGFIHQESGKDMGAKFLSIGVYIAVVVMASFYLFTQINVMTYYSLISVFGIWLLMIAVMCLFQSGSNLEWVGFYGEAFNSERCLLMIMTIFLAGVTPLYVFRAVLLDLQDSQVIRMVEVETAAMSKDEPLFYSPPEKKKAAGEVHIPYQGKPSPAA